MYGDMIQNLSCELQSDGQDRWAEEDQEQIAAETMQLMVGEDEENHCRLDMSMTVYQ